MDNADESGLAAQGMAKHLVAVAGKSKHHAWLTRALGISGALWCLGAAWTAALGLPVVAAGALATGAAFAVGAAAAKVSSMKGEKAAKWLGGELVSGVGELEAGNWVSRARKANDQKDFDSLDEVRSWVRKAAVEERMKANKALREGRQNEDIRVGLSMDAGLITRKISNPEGQKLSGSEKLALIAKRLAQSKQKLDHLSQEDRERAPNAAPRPKRA